TKDEARLFAEAGIELLAQEQIEGGAALDEVDALLVVSAKIPGDVIDRLVRCRVISRYGTGVDNVDVEYATRVGIAVTNVPDFCTGEMADHTMALLLALSRNVLEMDRRTRQGRWQARVEVPAHRIAGRTLGLVGLGRIARAVALRALAFDLHVVAYDPYMQQEVAGRSQVPLLALDELLETSDFVSLHLPLSPETRGLIGERELSLMRPGSYLLNTARGGLVDEKALVQALRDKRIAGAGIDVYESLAMFDPHPVRIEHALFHLDNVIVTPHSGGCSVEALDQLKTEGARQAIAVLQGERPSNFVNPQVTPRLLRAKREPQTNVDSDSKVAVVTGATGGLGAALSREFAMTGYRVFVTDRSPDLLADLTRVIRESGAEIEGCAADLSIADQPRFVIEHAIEKFGRVDVLVNNAGISSAKPIWELTETDWDHVFDVNVKALFFTLQQAARHLGGKGGSIVNIASVAGRVGRPALLHYAASKAAVISITRSAAMALAQHKVRVNAVAPGMMDTGMLRELQTALDSNGGPGSPQLSSRSAALRSPRRSLKLSCFWPAAARPILPVRP
ncbi:MAG: SDR family NAD(P)-dependent oxidoreductase, partial [Bryobacteraceae bacterium]